MQGDSKKQFNRGFTMVELMVTIVILAVLAAVAIPSFSGYYKKMDMINVNESARQIYGIAQNKLSAMKVAGQLQKDQLENEYGLFGVLPNESAATTASVDGIQYYYMNTDAAIAFLDQAGQKLDEKLINEQASIVIEMDPENGYVYGVFFATYPNPNSSEIPILFDYDSTGGTHGLQKGTEEFRTSDALRSQGKTRIGYYGGESALLEYEAGLKTPLIEIINDEELILKISSYDQPTDFTGYQVTIKEIDTVPYEYTRYIDKNAFIKKDGDTLNGNYYNLLLDSLAYDGTKPYSMDEILGDSTQFKQISTTVYKPCSNIEISVEAVNKSAEDVIVKKSFANIDEVSSLFAEKTKNEAGNDIITVSNVRHLQNLSRISEDDALNSTSTQVIQDQDIDWLKTIHYYKTLDSWASKDKVNNALEDRTQKNGEHAKFTSIPSGYYKYSAKRKLSEGVTNEDSTKAGYLISNLPIVGENNGGLFATYAGPLLEHINLVNVSVEGIEGTKNVGALVGEFSGNNILNCSAYLNKDLYSYPDAFSYNNYSIKGGNESTGGLVGVMDSGIIKNSFASINVKGKGGAAGGLVGILNNASITHSYSTGQVSGVENAIALGGFVGIYNQNTEATLISNCYTTSEITSMKPTMGSFVGKYNGSNNIMITKSYATGALVSTLNWESITQIGFIGGNSTGTVQADCFYLGNEDSNGAMGLNIRQLTGFEEVRPGKKIYSKDGNTYNDIYTIGDGWRYPDNFGMGPISEPDLAHPLTHPYYLDKRLSKTEDKVYPYPGLNDVDVAIASIPHYGDWSKTKEDLGGGSYIFYYEKYANNEYGVYFKVNGSNGVNTLRPDDKIIKWGYGIIAKESELDTPMNIYRRNADKSGTLLAPSKKIEDWVDTNALTVNNVSLNSSFRFYAFLDTSMKTFLDSMENPKIQYLYTIISSANLYNMFNPCFATAVNAETIGNINPSQMPVMAMGTAKEPFKIRHAEHFYYMGNKGYDGVDSEYFYFEQTRYIDFQDNFNYVKTEKDIPYSFKDNFYPKEYRYNGEFTPANPFVGVYNGNGFDIRGYVRYSSWEKNQLQYDGLFGYIGDGDGNGQISNVNLHVKSVDVVIKDALYAGIFAGYVGEKSVIHNCHITITNNENIKEPVKIWKYPGIPFGGFVGSSSGNISNSSINSEKPFACTYYITEQKDENEKEAQGIRIEKLQREGSLGGFAGENKATGTMYECEVKVNGYIGSDTSSIAGFVGKNENVIQKCNVIIGDRIKAAFAYGFVGRNTKSGFILDCKVNSKFIEAINYKYAVGFTGANEGKIENSHVNINKILGAKVYGFAMENVPENLPNKQSYKPIIVDCTVTSEILGTEVGDYGAESIGFVGMNNGEVLRASVSVTKEMNGQTVYGFAIENNINGSIINSSLFSNNIKTSGTGLSYGFIYKNDGLINNITAQNNQNRGQNKVYGFIYSNSETGTITNILLRGNSISSNDDLFGFVWENKGIIEGVQVFIEGDSNNNTSGTLSSQRVYGFAYANFNTIKDSSLVCNAIIGSGDVCGFARENNGFIENAQVTIDGTDNVNTTGILKGQNTYGFVYANYNEIKNSTLLCNAIIGSEFVCGFARENWELIVNAKVDIVRNNYGNTAAIIKGRNVYGFIYQNHIDAIIQDSYISSEDASALGKIFGFAYENNGIIKSEITGCYSNIPIVTVTPSYERVAGFIDINTGSILGKAPDAETDAIFIEYKGNTIETLGNAAGFVLDNQGTIEYAAVHSEDTAEINTLSDSAGFALENKGSIKNCYTKSNLTSPTGNLAGFVSYNEKDIENCYNQGVLRNINVNWGLCIGGFAYKTSGNISNCFSISSVMNEEQGNEAITAGFAVLVSAGTITNSYAITNSDKINSNPYIFSPNTSNITNCFYLDWDGISDAKQNDTNTSAEAKKMAELEKLVEDNILPSNIWQTNYKVTTNTYTYPTIIGLPLPDYNSEFEPNPPSWTVSGGDVTGGNVTNGDVTGGNLTGGVAREDVTSSNVISGNVKSGDVTGGDGSE